MPREVIYDEAETYNTIVKWEPEKYLQVGIETRDGRPLIDYLGCPRCNAANSNAQSPDPALFKSVWGTLTRAGVNKLIRDLRRARNQTFGADE